MPPKKPLIGLTASEQPDTKSPWLPAAYTDALRECGALPLILPLTLSAEDCEQLAAFLDGFLFTGGPDLHPFLFGEETLTGCGNQSGKRDRTELLLFSFVQQKKKPILAVCRGIQLINVALGGDLVQDIGQIENRLPIAHRQPFPLDVPSHHVTVTPGSRLAAALGCRDGVRESYTIAVNSAHHQALRRTAPALTVCGRAPDGIIEAVECPEYPFLIGVQWHPERLYGSRSFSEHANRLFRSFVRACSGTCAP